MSLKAGLLRSGPDLAREMRFILLLVDVDKDRPRVGEEVLFVVWINRLLETFMLCQEEFRVFVEVGTPLCWGVARDSREDGCASLILCCHNLQTLY